MLSKLKLSQYHLKSAVRLMCSAAPTNFRVAVENENENHDAMRMNGSERYKYKTNTTENSFSQNHTLVEDTSSVVEKIQVLSSVQAQQKMNRDTNTQSPFESESELAGQGLARLNNGHFNKVRVSSYAKKNRFHKRRRLLSEENAKKNYETQKKVG